MVVASQKVVAFRRKLNIIFGDFGQGFGSQTSRVKGDTAPFSLNFPHLAPAKKRRSLMDTLETKRLEMFGNVRELGSQHTAQFPAGSYGRELFARLDTVISGLEEHSLRQSTGKSSVREGTSSKSALRDELWRRLEAISRTARVIAFTSPGLEDKFRLTRGVGDQALIQLARTFAADAEPIKAEFIRRGMVANFIEDLAEVAGEFADAINLKAQG